VKDNALAPSSPGNEERVAPSEHEPPYYTNLFVSCGLFDYTLQTNTHQAVLEWDKLLLSKQFNNPWKMPDWNLGRLAKEIFSG